MNAADRALPPVLARLAPLRVLPSMAAALDAYAAGDLDEESRRRLDGYRSTLRGMGPGGLLSARSAHREESGRIRLDGPPVQQIANVLRGHIAPSEPGRVFIDADYSAAHLRIAATVTGDERLAAAVATDDPYAALAAEALPDVVDRARARAAMKVCALALINGAGPAALIGALLGVVDDPPATATAILAGWRAAFPKLSAFVSDVADRDGLRALAARWATVEAACLDVVLDDVERAIGADGGRVVLPMFDGLLLDAPEASASTVAAAVDRVMMAAMQAAGVAARVTVEVRPRWGDAPPSDEVDPEDTDGRVVIQFYDTSNLAWLGDQLVGRLASASSVFVHGSLLVDVVGRRGVRTVRTLGPVPLRDRLSRLVNVLTMQRVGDGYEWRPRRLSIDDAKIVEARAHWPGVRVLRRMVHDPTLRPDGSIVGRDGYDDATGVFLDLDPRWSGRPRPRFGREAAYEAGLRLAALVSDFGLDQTGIAVFVASVLTQIGRHLIKGPTPLTVFEAAIRGAGKSKLATLSMLIGSPMEPSAGTLAPAERDEERSKAITAILLSAPTAYLFDNVVGVVGSASLDRVLTATTWSDRYLGANRIVTLPNATTWFLTANNANLSAADTVRRIVIARLDPGTDRPENRGGFKIERIEEHVRAERLRYYADALTILGSYLVEGRPSQDVGRFGSYEEWTNIVASAVLWAGLGNPLASREKLEDRDEQAIALAALIEALVQRFRDAPFLARTVSDVAVGDAVLRDALDTLTHSKVDARGVGLAFREVEGRRDPLGRCIASGGLDRTGTRLWCIVPGAGT